MKIRLSRLFLLVFLASSLTVKSQQTVIFKQIGDKVVLKPPTSTASSITRILWKQKDALAVEWEGEIERYSPFKDRSHLNTTTGELTITNLTKELSGDYEVQINGDVLGGPTLKVLDPLPKPSISSSCNEEKTRCTLTCEGDVRAMDPAPTYIWKFNATELKTPTNNFEITPETSAYHFICELENPVSRESSEPIEDPFYQVSESTGVSGLKINTGLIVFASLSAIVVGVALVHRVKSGMWFYQKDSMPWERDFWSKSGSQAPSEPQPAIEDPAERNTMIESNS